MPDCEDLKQQDSEDDNDYIARLKQCLYKLFEQHIKENKGKPLFASDIKDDKEREEWKARQLEQWNERHKILEILVKESNREKEEIINDDHFSEVKYLELRQRWLTPEGKAFLTAIIAELQKLENLWFLERRDEEQPGPDFPSIALDNNNERFTDFYYVHQTEKRKYRDLRYADLQRARLCLANLKDANLQGASLRWSQLQGACLWQAQLRQAYLWRAQLHRADLYWAELQGAVLCWAKLQGARLSYANIQGANLSGAVIAGPALRRGGPQTGDPEKEIDYRSADFTGVEKFSREWRGPLWMALFVSIVSFLWVKIRNKVLKHKKKKKWKRLAWRKWIQKEEDKEDEKGKKKKWEEELKEYPEPKRWYAGRPTTFFGVDTSRMDGSKNPGLKRYIEDEQYIEDFKEKHRVIYWLWAMSSDCGRCLSLWAFWSIVIAGIFGFLYAGYIPYPDWMPQDGQVEYVLCPELTIDYTAETTMRDPVTGLKEPLREKTWFTPYYYSIVTFTTLGFGDIKPRNLSAEILLTSEVVLGYFFLGGLVAILASKLARRA